MTLQERVDSDLKEAMRAKAEALKAVGASEVGEFCCKKVCICLDFVEAPGGQIPEPASCQPGKSSCHNVN